MYLCLFFRLNIFKNSSIKILKYIFRRDEILNNEFSQCDFTLDQGERLLQGMQSLRDDLNIFGDTVQGLTVQAQDVVPLKQRRQPVTRPLPVKAICNYKQANVRIFSINYKHLI